MTTQLGNSDVLVIGGGMAGLVAALQAQALGARVTVLEKGPAVGGSLALSGGTIWCARTVEDLRRLVPRGDPELGAALVADFEPGIAWLRDLGATLTALPSEPHRSVYWTEPNPRVFVAGLLARFESGGGRVVTDASVSSLRFNAAGAIEGVVARTPNGLRSFTAPSVILATGGFQGNPAMRAQYFGQWADRLITRGNPHSTGDGFWMATDAGAAPSKAMSSFYGHLLPAPPARVPVNDFIGYTMYHSEQSVLLNLRGDRFTDESLGDETSCQAVARQPEALAWLIYDEVVYRDFARRPGGGGARATDTFYESKALGAPAASAASLEELAAAVDALGGHGPGVLATLREFNAAVAAGAAAQLRIPRRAKANPVTNPPFYALAVTPGITFTLGGIRIDPDARVLDRAGRPIDGLYAAGADAGGIHNEQYAGGLCLGLVFGRRAARGAVNPKG
jgi:succinate dehydrogenase/fumarate reductase flavoprotein subunit